MDTTTCDTTLATIQSRIADLIDEARFCCGDRAVTEMLLRERTRIESRRPTVAAIDVRPFWKGRPRRLVPASTLDVRIGDWINWTNRYRPFDRAVFQVLSIGDESGVPVAQCSVQGRDIDTWAPVEWPTWSPSCRVSLHLRSLRRLERP